MNREVGLGDIEGLRIEGPAYPLEHVLVLGVLWIRNGLKEIKVPVAPAAVLRWTGALARLDDGIQRTALWWKHGLQDHFVLPAVAEVILVKEAILRAAEELIQSGPGFTDSGNAELAIRATVQGAPGLELVEVAVRPSHNDL